MDWVAELRRKFQQVRAGLAARPVSFAARADLIGEVGREFNALLAALQPTEPRALSRDQAHVLRNHLAGILAALHVLREDGSLSRDQQAHLQKVIEEGRRLDAGLRTGTQ